MIQELVTKLNESKISQNSGEWTEDLPEELWEELKALGYKMLKSGLDVDQRRWYETSVEVFSVNGGLIGCRSITNLYSEQSAYSDICYTLKFYEMEEIQSVDYIKKA